MARTPETKVKFSVFNEEFKQGINEITKDTTRLRKEFKLEAEQMKHTSTASGKLEHNIKRLGREKENVRKKIELTEKQLQKAKEYYGENSEEARRLENQLLDLQVSEQKLENAITETEGKLREQGKAFVDGKADAEKYKKSLSEIGESMEKSGKKIQDAGKNISSFGRSWSTKVTAPIVATGGAVFKLASDWESSWIGVEKVIEGTEEELANLEQGLRNMAKEMPATHQEIAEVAAAAGQLGIETQNIEEFTRVMLDLSVATNMSADEAATSLARLANITGMSADDYDKLGATIVDLGNNLATTEKEIVEMGLRLAGAGKQIGLTEAQTLAFAGSLSSVGIAAEAGGSAFSKVMVNMQLAAERGGAELENFAKVAGMSASDFKKAFEKDAAGALIAFIQGLGEMEDSGDSAIGTLDEIGITEVRMRDALLRAAGASDLFTESMEIGSKAWDENLALTEEAEKRYNSTEAQLKIMWNRIKDVGIELGQALVPAVMSALDALEPFIEKLSDGADAFAEMDEEQQRNILKLIGLVAAIGPVSVALGGMTTAIGGVVRTGGTLLKVFGSVKGGVGLLGRIGMLGMTGPVGIAIGAITGLGAAIYALNKHSENSSKKVTESLQARQDELDVLDDTIAQYEKLLDKNKLTSDEILRYMDIMSELEEAESDETIKKLTDEQADLLKKSGLTNDEMEEFLRLNDEIIEKSPEAAKAISEEGNAYVDNLEKLKELNEYERQRLMEDTYRQLTSELDKQAENLEKQAELQREIKILEGDRELEIQKSIEAGERVREIDQELVDLSEQKSGATSEELSRIRDKEQVLEAEKSTLQGNLETHDKTIGKIDNQIEKKQESLDKTNDELSLFDELLDDYARMILQEEGITAEKGRGVEKLKEEQREIDKAREKLKKQYESQEISTAEYQEQNKKLDTQQGKIDRAREKMDNFNRVANKRIDKDVYVTTSPTADKINEALGKPVHKRVKVVQEVASRGFSSFGKIFGYAKGTNFHPGGPAVVGEEGPELIRQGRKWSLADLGMYNLKRGAQVFTAEQTKKMLNGIRRMPAYAYGTGVNPAMSERLNRLGRNLVDSQIVNNSVFVNIEATDVIMDGKKVGEITWEPVKENIERNNIQKARARGDVL